MTQDIDRLDAIVAMAPVIPVLLFDDPESAVAIGRALVRGGLPVLEITLRTPAALDCLTACKAIEGAVVGAGTVLDIDQLTAAVACGAEFLVSPGASPKLIHAAEGSPVPLLPGVATAGEAMTLAEHGYRRMKFFPAEPAGGAEYLKALASPLPHLRFCPTGGITLEKAPKYLALPNVMCVGGSWVVPADAVKARDWARIETLAREAAALARR
ncbi:bifunctional 4-hydroxy-2-oxoglutarate aldolase/2-dehydro-3-deoxy-phosphogluconate aldolase [Prosthecomicrobium hirschii]|uniref:bifunctional 4-hydroxy-2-oxoglutarate aldolase/2-dehydro-3-deoxy-phosphogluconate aldolase n=1 Tax=Prosthecodimorpha hirschii TaxID=665126 RepID=UPI00221F2199|nr:bifunctional 4-hydroxy-2-oxoglutarate aldolase/2-dehydro-3-deoxy-phosphogluconate aldolase [Prosthecomicrobium hirschii]MCW1841024.1 bifunctional 4-hydroxy-2-oxoglutarate aldolase/2-dehydro-3-deoxy-phosphogluconate aldolase [Prosthecomicrobium hirschii]